MLKAVVFDDEYIVLQGLQMMIDWSKYGIQLVGTASDGQAALDLFMTQRPDIVFTDIRMPVLDGLQVVEKILTEAPETICIVFSGFNEFEYVKRAINLGVTDYLEKPITIPMIEDAIKKTVDRISQHKSFSSIQAKWEESQQELLEKATLELLLLGATGEAKWRDLFGIDADKVVAVTVLALSEYSHIVKEHPSYRIIHARNGSEELLALFHFENDADALWKQLLYWPENAGVTVGSGRTYSKISDAVKSCKEALQALRYGHFMDEKGWTRIEDVGENVNLPANLSENEEAVIYSIRTGDKTGLLLQLNLFIKQLEAQRLVPDILERELLKLVYLGMEIAKETGGNDYINRLTNYLPHVEIRGLKTKEGMFSWFRNQMEMIMDWSLEVRRDRKHAAVEDACNYMKKNYNKELTLQEVADYVGMNSTYFSLLFKEEMGKSYIKYLTQLRIEHAKLHLAEGVKVTDVSEKVGYHSYRHFSDIFKKLVGVKPGQYRESIKGNS